MFTLKSKDGWLYQHNNKKSINDRAARHLVFKCKDVKFKFKKLYFTIDLTKDSEHIDFTRFTNIEFEGKRIKRSRTFQIRHYTKTYKDDVVHYKVKLK